MNLVIKFCKIIISFFKITSKYEFLKNIDLQKKSDLAFAKRLHKFKKQHKRKSNRNEIFLIAVTTSHDVVKQLRRRGHWTRQRVRKYLLEKNKIREHYKMQPSKI
ncbi:hypothetical protein J4225_00450 [Candidatus Pacearchaeota archaeon]|nr:hypothetical protein [uncultured archaeon]MBS3085140.1 hypothetical protein [Candidatus Pacearchaeota archaeon]